MKANQSSRTRLGQDEQAVSAVIGAVLVLAVITIALVQWRLEWVPVIEGEDEAGVALLVDGQMGAVRAHFNNLATNASNDAAALPVKLGAPEGRGFENAVTLPNQLEMRPSEGLWNVTAPSFLMYHRDGHSLGAVGNSWTGIPSSVAINDVRSVQELRWRIDEVDAAHDTRAARATILDHKAAFAGSYEVLVDVQSPNMLVHHTVKNAASETITSRTDSYAESTAFAPYFVNLLEPGIAFAQVLAVAQGPLTLVMSQDPGFDTDYMAAYHVAGPTGRIPIATSGVLYPGYEATLGGGTLTYRSHNAFYPGQEVSIESGSIIIRQDDGSVFRSEPLLHVANVGDRILIDVVAPRLIGDGSSISGDLVANVVGIPMDQDTIAGSASQLEMTLETRSPGIWAALFQQRLSAAGLSDQGTEPGFLVNKTATGVTVQIFGPQSNPTSAERDVILAFQTADVLVDLDT